MCWDTMYSAAPVSSGILKSNARFWLNEELRHLQNETKRKKNKVDASCLLLRLMFAHDLKLEEERNTFLSQFQNTFYFNKVWLVPHNCILFNLEWTSLNIIILLPYAQLHCTLYALIFSSAHPTVSPPSFKALFHFVGSDLLIIINDSPSPGFSFCFKHANSKLIYIQHLTQTFGHSWETLWF